MATANQPHQTEPVSAQRQIARLLFHALPLLPLVYELWFFFAASVLFVLSPYIKTKKLTEAAADRRARQGEQASAQDSEHLSQLRAAARWRWLTFLPEPE